MSLSITKPSHEWMIEEVEDTFWGKVPHPAVPRLAVLEEEGWTIHSVSPIPRGTSIQIVAFRDRS